MSKATGREVFYKTAFGQTAGLEWGDPKSETLICLHGWLDNAASFEPIAEFIADRFHVIALDLPGHGHSSSLPDLMSYQLADSVAWLHEIISLVTERTPTIVGHSLGGVVASLYAGTFPNSLARLVLIDAIGPLVSKDGEAPQRFRGYVESITKWRQGQRGSRRFKSVQQACDQRMNFSISPMQAQSARLIVERGLEFVDSAQEWRWRHDDRLKWPSPIRMTEAQVHAFLREIKVSTLLVCAEPGLGLTPAVVGTRMSLIHDMEIHKVDGFHHVHMDAPEHVAKLINEFIK